MENKNTYLDWLKLSQLTESVTTIACFEEVEKQYTHASRYYHTLGHVNDLFTHIKKAGLSDEETTILAHVALFHDVIYNSVSKENEINKNIKVFTDKRAKARKKVVDAKRAEEKRIAEVITINQLKLLPVESELQKAKRLLQYVILFVQKKKDLIL